MRISVRRVRLWARMMALLGSACLGLGCERNTTPTSVPPKTPTLRVYAISTLAGAIEPCGCVKDMLGGIDHAAAFLQSQAREAQNSVVLAAGPLFFMDPSLDAAAKDQQLFKAIAIAESLRDMGLAAWAPGANDWAAGSAKLAELRDKASATLLAANLGEAKELAQPLRVLSVGGLKVGLAGVSEPESENPAVPKGTQPPTAALAAAGKQLEAQGAQIRIALLALARGQALRAIEGVPGFQLAILGKPKDAGEANEAVTPPVLVNRTLVVQAPNHLQAVGIVDLFVRGDAYDFQDGSGIALFARRASIEQRISELKARILDWERRGAAIAQKDLEARRRDLRRLEEELSTLSSPAPPEKGSFFRYKLVEVREKLGSLAAVRAKIEGYYAKVNEHNREAFRDLKPAPVSASESGYVGVEKCSVCHGEERQFWNSTRHAKAYATLATAHKQFNLECVGCHVTGYQKPGGTTVTHVAGLESVQCEVCHGPGSRHVIAPTNPAFLIAKPARTLCAPACHHPPHVKPDWNVDAAWKGILGPGHGM
jgi:hypothetical protein